MITQIVSGLVVVSICQELNEQLSRVLIIVVVIPTKTH